MEIYSANVLQDILLFCLVSIGIAIPLFSYIRHVSPEIGWHETGQIRTQHFSSLDILGIFLTSLFYIANLVFANTNPDAAPDTQQISNLSMLFGGLISQLLPVGIAAAFLIPRMNVPEIFGLRHPDVKKVLIVGFLGLICIYLGLAFADPIFSSLLENNLGKPELQVPVQMIIDAKQNNSGMLIILAFLAVIVAPICEEFVFRGYIYGTLKRFSCRIFATIASALFFAVVHASLWSLIPLFIVGLALAIIYEISGSLWAAILTHMLFNGVTTFALIFVLNDQNLPY